MDLLQMAALDSEDLSGPCPHPLSMFSQVAEATTSPSKSPKQFSHGPTKTHTTTAPPRSSGKENIRPRHSLSSQLNDKYHAKPSFLDDQPVAIETPRKQNLRPFSPRKHVVQNGTVSFTPCREQLPPRAWERVPAKPFAASRDGQKIWKRVPLQDIGIDVNLQGQESRREKEARQDYLRAVKRLKVDGTDRDQDDSSAGKNASEAGFLTTRFEEDSIEKGGSPKKKTRHPPVLLQTTNSTVDLALEQIEENLDKSDLTSSIGQPELGIPPSAQEVETENSLDSSLRTGLEPRKNPSESPTHSNENSPVPALVEQISTPDKTLNDNLNRISTHEDEEDVDVGTPQTGHNNAIENNDRTPEYSKSDYSRSAATTTDIIPLPSSSDQAAGNVGHADEQTLMADCQSTENVGSAAVETAEIVAIAALDVPQSSIGSNPSSTPFQNDTSSIACADLFDLSGPTTIGEPDPVFSNDVHDEIKATSEADILASMPSPEASKTSTAKPIVLFAGIEQEEDTAFLADFLLRAKASKAAREAASTQQGTQEAESPGKTPSPVHKGSGDGQSPAAISAADNDTVEHSAAPTSPSANVLDQTVEVSASSPLRRSARAANPRLPRPQTLPPVPQFGPVLPSQNNTLPNTIQLKRATGNEFVFTAKPQQTVQMMTRTNTKRNQGNAVHVDVRLQQLKTVDSNTTSVDGLSQQNSSPSKKRKRVKDDDGKTSRKSKKNVKWQEELVSYREATPTAPETSLSASDDFAAIEAAAQAEALRSMTDSFNLPSEADPSSADRSDVDDVDEDHGLSDSSKGKVRKMRRINVGNVNGTPAPKTRTRSRMQSHSEAESISTAPAPALTPKSRSRAGPKSKMPVPVSTSASITKAGSSITASEDRKLDGGRRLRART